MSRFHIEQIRSHLGNIFGREYCKPDLDEVANLSRQLAAYAAYLALDKQEGDDSVEVVVTDGGKDRGIDAIAIDETSKTGVVVQAKWRQDGTGSIDLAGVLKFLDGTRALIGMNQGSPITDRIDDEKDAPRARAKRKLSTLLAEPGARLMLVTVTTAASPLSEDVEAPICEILKNINDIEVEEPLAAHRHFGQSDLFRSIRGHAVDSVDLNVQFVDWGRALTPYKIYYGRVSGAEISKWYQDFGNMLFNENIRLVIPRSDINDGMVQTLRTAPERFLYYNNGITVISKQIISSIAGKTNREATMLSLHGASIVNGAQTVSTLGRVADRYTDIDLSAAQVMVKCVEVSEEEDELGNLITRYANTQNDVSTQDFAFLDPEQHRLAHELETLGFYYAIRANDKPAPGSEMTQIELRDAAVALACGAGAIGPSVIAKREVSRLFSDSGVYKTLFNPMTEPVYLLNCVSVVRCVDDYLDSVIEGAQGVTAGIALHGRRAIAHCVLMSISSVELKGSVIDSSLAKGRIEHLSRTALSRMEGAFPDNSYPGNLFKNQKRVGELIERSGLSRKIPEGDEA